MIGERIQRLRTQILVHSILYYKMGESIWTDEQFDKTAYELVRLQTEHEEESEMVEYHLEAFRDFDGSTGYHLPLNDPHATYIATWLLKKQEEK